MFAERVCKVKIKMLKITKFTPKDLIAIIVLLACFALKAIGINSYIDIVIAVIVGYYFGRRIDYEITNNQKPITATFGEVKKPELPLKVETETTGDFKPTPTSIRPNPVPQTSPIYPTPSSVPSSPIKS